MHFVAVDLRALAHVLNGSDCVVGKHMEILRVASLRTAGAALVVNKRCNSVGCVNVGIGVVINGAVVFGAVHRDHDRERSLPFGQDQLAAQCELAAGKRDDLLPQGQANRITAG